MAGKVPQELSTAIKGTDSKQQKKKKTTKSTKSSFLNKDTIIQQSKIFVQEVTPCLTEEKLFIITTTLFCSSSHQFYSVS